MNWKPREVWQDGDTFISSGEDRVGMLAIALFASVLSVWIVPGLLTRARQLARSFQH